LLGENWRAGERAPARSSGDLAPCPAPRHIPAWASGLLISLASLSRLCRAAARASVVALRRSGEVPPGASATQPRCGDRSVQPFLPRSDSTATEWRSGVSVAKRPPSTKRIFYHTVARISQRTLDASGIFRPNIVSSLPKRRNPEGSQRVHWKLVHRFQSSNHIRRLYRVCVTMCGRRDRG
jgi:hypothetical protein